MLVLVLVAVGAAGYFSYQARQDKTDYSAIEAKPRKTSTPVVSSDEAAPTTSNTTTQYVNGATLELDKTVGNLLYWNLTNENINLSSESLLAMEKQLYGDQTLWCKANDYPLGRVSVRDESGVFPGYTLIKKLDSGKYLSYADDSPQSFCYKNRDKLRSMIEQQVGHLKAALPNAR